MFDFKKVIVINGPAGAGKDTFVELCQEIFNKIFHSEVFNFSSIIPVKRLAMEMGWDGVKDEKGRKFLADLKMLWASFNNGPTSYLLECASGVLAGLVFLHVREPEEILKLKELIPDVVLLHVDREGALELVNGADDRTLEINYDYYIDNNGDKDALKKICLDFIMHLLSEELNLEEPKFVREGKIARRLR